MAVHTYSGARFKHVGGKLDTVDLVIFSYQEVFTVGRRRNAGLQTGESFECGVVICRKYFFIRFSNGKLVFGCFQTSILVSEGPVALRSAKNAIINDFTHNNNHCRVSEGFFQKHVCGPFAAPAKGRQNCGSRHVHAQGVQVIAMFGGIERSHGEWPSWEGGPLFICSKNRGNFRFFAVVCHCIVRSLTTPYY